MRWGLSSGECPTQSPFICSSSCGEWWIVGVGACLLNLLCLLKSVNWQYLMTQTHRQPGLQSLLLCLLSPPFPIRSSQCIYIYTVYVYIYIYIHMYSFRSRVGSLSVSALKYNTFHHIRQDEMERTHFSSTDFTHIMN